MQLNSYETLGETVELYRKQLRKIIAAKSERTGYCPHDVTFFFLFWLFFCQSK